MSLGPHASDSAATPQTLHALLRAEMRLREGVVEDLLADPLREAPTYQLAADAFILKLPSGLRFLYRRGEGVVFQRPTSVPDNVVTLLLNTAVYSTVSYLNGLVPLHASAVVHEGRVHAFSGVSGGGKSTLAAALATRGLSVFADDVLALVPGGDGPAQALPEQRPMKLWADAIELTGVDAGEKVREKVEKFYVEFEGGSAGPRPLAALYLLTDRAKEEPQLTPVRGAARFNAVRSAIYRRAFCASLLDSRDYFAIMARFSNTFPVFRFDRPRRKEVFWDGVDVVEAAIREGHDIG